MRTPIMDPREAEKLIFQRMRLFMLETEAIQNGIDRIVERLVAGEEVGGSAVQELAERLRAARSRLGAELGKDAA